MAEPIRRSPVAKQLQIFTAPFPQLHPITCVSFLWSSFGTHASAAIGMGVEHRRPCGRCTRGLDFVLGTLTPGTLKPSMRRALQKCSRYFAWFCMSRISPRANVRFQRAWAGRLMGTMHSIASSDRDPMKVIAKFLSEQFSQVPLLAADGSLLCSV